MGKDCTGIGLLGRAGRDRQETDFLERKEECEQPPNDQFSRSDREAAWKGRASSKAKLYNIQLNKAKSEMRQLRPETETVPCQCRS